MGKPSRLAGEWGTRILRSYDRAITRHEKGCSLCGSSLWDCEVRAMYAESARDLAALMVNDGLTPDMAKSVADLFRAEGKSQEGLDRHREVCPICRKSPHDPCLLAKDLLGKVEKVRRQRVEAVSRIG